MPSSEVLSDVGAPRRGRLPTGWRGLIGGDRGGGPGKKVDGGGARVDHGRGDSIVRDSGMETEGRWAAVRDRHVVRVGGLVVRTWRAGASGSGGGGWSKSLGTGHELDGTVLAASVAPEFGWLGTLGWGLREGRRRSRRGRGRLSGELARP